jgi:hypothetical protein
MAEAAATGSRAGAPARRPSFAGAVVSFVQRVMTPRGSAGSSNSSALRGGGGGVGGSSRSPGAKQPAVQQRPDRQAPSAAESISVGASLSGAALGASCKIVWGVGVAGGDGDSAGTDRVGDAPAACVPCCQPDAGASYNPDAGDPSASSSCLEQGEEDGVHPEASARPCHTTQQKGSLAAGSALPPPPPGAISVPQGHLAIAPGTGLQRSVPISGSGGRAAQAGQGAIGSAGASGGHGGGSILSQLLLRRSRSGAALAASPAQLLPSSNDAPAPDGRDGSASSGRAAASVTTPAPPASPRSILSSLRARLPQRAGG